LKGEGGEKGDDHELTDFLYFLGIQSHRYWLRVLTHLHVYYASAEGLQEERRRWNPWKWYYLQTLCDLLPV